MNKPNTTLSTVQQEHHEAYRNFVKNTEIVINLLKNGSNLQALENKCDLICKNNCKNDAESEPCNILMWIKLLNKSKSLIPDDDVIQFLTYIISGNAKVFTEETQSSLHRWSLQTFNTSYKKFETAKTQIIKHLDAGKDFIDFEDAKNPYANLLSNFLWEADSLNIIPGGNIVHFLKFI